MGRSRLQPHRLPKQVFATAVGYFLFFEFARAFGEGAWRLFARLAHEFGDSMVWTKTVEPDPRTYYELNFGRVAEFAFPAAVDDAGTYTSHMHNWPAANIADAIAYRADVVAWGGTNGRWAAWGERELNLCVLHVVAHERLAKELVLMPDDFVPLFAVEDAISNIVSSELGAQELAEFASEMRRSYLVACG
jgi:hypothetical protein